MSRLVILAAVLLQGCTVIQSAQIAVARYCALPEPDRAVARQAAALALAPNRITIDCAEVR